VVQDVLKLVIDPKESGLRKRISHPFPIMFCDKIKGEVNMVDNPEVLSS